MVVNRHECLTKLAATLPEDTIVVVGLGINKKEWGSLRPSDAAIFFGQLGGTVALGLGIALALPHRQVIVITTDGDLLMELGQLPPVADQEPQNLTVVIIDNGCYEVLGSNQGGPRPTHTAVKTDLAKVAGGCGIAKVHSVSSLAGFAGIIMDLKGGPNIIVVKTKPALSQAPAYNHTDGIENKYRFARYIEKTENIRVIADLE